MQRFEDATTMRAWSRRQRQEGRRVALVPTMGALHAGHRALIEQARREAEAVVVSIYVNPTQFDNPADLDAYPQQLAADLAICEAAGVAAVFLPTDAQMYPQGFATFVEVVGGLSDKLCGVTRPGHFRGVCTVVTKLFNIVEPDSAFFGRKDLQQSLIIARLIRDLELPIQIHLVDTVRESDGLALSSRNARLSIAARTIALGIPRGLVLADRAFRRGERSAMRLIEHFAEQVLVEPDVDIDYAHVIRLRDFEEVDQVEAGCVLTVAVFVGPVRLIDHIALGAETIAGVVIEED